MSTSSAKPPESDEQALQTDADLVRMIRDGNEDAARLLYDRYVRRILGLVRSQMGPKLRAHSATEDIVQSVFKSLFRRVASGQYDAPPGETLWNLLAVVAINKVRRRGNQLNAQCRDVERHVPLEGLENKLAEDLVTADLLSLTIQEVFETLRPADRQIMELRMQHYTVDEIHALTGFARRRIERSLQQSRGRLAKLIEDGHAD